MAENRWVAIVLNLFFYGLGYVYLGKRKTFWVLLFVARVALFVPFVYSYFIPLTSTTLNYVNLNSVGVGLLALVFAYDAFQLSKEPPSA